MLFLPLSLARRHRGTHRSYANCLASPRIAPAAAQSERERCLSCVYARGLYRSPEHTCRHTNAFRLSLSLSLSHTHADMNSNDALLMLRFMPGNARAAARARDTYRLLIYGAAPPSICRPRARDFNPYIERRA